MTRRPATLRAIRLMIAGLLATSVLAACGDGRTDAGTGATGASPELQKLIDAAKKEGTLTWYSVPAENAAKAASDAFSRKYGIPVKYIRLTSGDLSQRYAAEAESGKPAADLFLQSFTPFIAQAAQKGWTTKLADAQIPDYAEGYPQEYLFPTEGTAVVQIQPSGLAVNTSKLNGVTIKDWPDVLDPKLKGQIILVDPRTSAAYIPFWNVIIKEYGEDFLTKLKAQNPRLGASSAPATQSLGAGEAAVVFPGVQTIVEDLKSKGAPVNYVQPGATTGPEVVVGLSAKAANPNAARLFIHFLMSTDGNKALNSVPGSYSPLEKSSLPGKYTFNKDAGTVPKEKIYSLLGLS
jgi:iron(III) transport system substrate-binding protein